VEEGTHPLVTLWGHLALNANHLVLAPFGAIIWPTSHEPFIASHPNLSLARLVQGDWGPDSSVGVGCLSDMVNPN